jgi:hypothetical protein
MPAVMPATIPLRPSGFVSNNPINNPRSVTNNPWGNAQAQVQAQTQAEAFAGLNPEAIQYLICAIKQYGQIPMNHPEQLHPQLDPPRNTRAETEGSLTGHTPRSFTGEHPKALEFLSDFNIYCICNDNNVSMKVPYYRVAICLEFFEGDKIHEWKDNQA